ncbi:MAG TPA: heme o synthase [Candidatus Saccharimonadales bacterium]
MRETIKTYRQLTKPGIIRGNVLAAADGFLLACAQHHTFNLALFWFLIEGTTLVIASACVFNNVIDRGIDTRMARTKKRALVTGRVSVRNALIYGSVLGLSGFYILAAYTNMLVLAVGAAAFCMYVVVYGYFKRRTYWGTLVGCVPGALPPVAGYVAVSGRFDVAAVLLFLILVFWQMPHFYSIALFRRKEYKAAGLPVFPVVHSARATKMQILGFIPVFVLLNIGLTVGGYTGVVYVIIMSTLGALWFWKGFSTFGTASDYAWGKSMFLFSLIMISTLSVMLSVGGLLA